MARLGAAIAHPLLVDVSVSVEGAQATRIYPRTLPDLFAEDELRVSGRFRGTGPVKFVISGKLEGKPVTYTRTVVPASSHAWPAPLWAQARVDHLLEQIQLDGANAKSELQTEIVDLALAYNFVTPYTAFLAVPESELGPAAQQTVAAARARKQKLVAQEGQDQGQGQSAQVPHVASTPDVMSADGPARMHERVAAAGDSDDDAHEDKLANDETVHGHGCAGCATSSGDGATSLLLIGLVAVFVLRRRAARSR